eukprot:Skav225401  [mRNA]  locus=scaffold2656:414712:420369:+ [translate_table: standard]
MLPLVEPQVLLLVIFFFQLRGTLPPADSADRGLEGTSTRASREELGRSLVEFFAFVCGFRRVNPRARRQILGAFQAALRISHGRCQQAEAGNFPFCTIDPNMGKAKVGENDFSRRRLGGAMGCAAA